MPTEEETKVNGDPFYVDDEDFQFQNESEPDASVHDETQSVTKDSTMDASPGNFSMKSSIRYVTNEITHKHITILIQSSYQY